MEIEKETNQFDFEYIKEEDLELDLELDLDFEIRDSEIMHNDYITNYIIRSEKVKKSYEEKLKADAKFNHYLQDFARDKYFNEDKFFKN